MSLLKPRSALPEESPSDTPPLKLPWWTKGDTNAFFGLGFNILVNVLTLTSLLIFVVQIPSRDVLGTVLPALGIAMLAGNIYYTVLARRLARRENRLDVTALPYGPSVPHMFIVVFVIMLPIYLATKDPVRHPRHRRRVLDRFARVARLHPHARVRRDRPVRPRARRHARPDPLTHLYTRSSAPGSVR